uniref:Uncharacterized protein n=1 Tax=Arcella intermedia TaxID=1963864 RepID=A0A6B2LSU9_9EUKA
MLLWGGLRGGLLKGHLEGCLGGRGGGGPGLVLLKWRVRRSRSGEASLGGRRRGKLVLRGVWLVG